MSVATAPNRPQAASAVGGKSCITCPSFVADAKQRAVMGSNLNSPICGRKMLPLVMPNQPQDAQQRALRHTATNCSMHGEQVDMTPLSPNDAPVMPVGLDAEALAVTVIDDQQNARCSNCVHHIPSLAVQAETGWTASICRKSGTLMPDNRLGVYAQKCGQFKARYGPRPFTGYFGNLMLFPMFDKNFGKVDPVAEYRAKMARIREPRDHSTEREVLAKHRERGIISWRKVTDPEGYGAPVFLPIFDKNFFDENLRVLVPSTGDDEHPELYADHGQLLYTMAVLWRELDETPAWWGQGGTGKTEFARHLAWLMQLPFHRLNITSSTELDDLVGKMRFENGETKYQLGRLPLAWQKPGVILLDEPNTGPPDVWQVIRPLTDNSRMLVLDQNRGERIKRGPDTYFAMAMNPAWDPRNVGTQTLGDADGSRLMHMFFTYPPHDLEVELIQKRVALDGWQLDAAQVKGLMGVAKDLRQASENGSLHSTWGVRHQIKAARALRWWPPVTAYRRAVGDSLEPAQLEFLITTVSSNFDK